MAKTNITQYSATPSSNTDINSINIDENCPASGLNNAIRELMAHLKNVDTGSQALTALSVTGAFSCGALTSNGIDDNADATAITIDSSENVGIGTSSPSAQLHISGTDTSDQVIIENTDTGGGSAPDLVLFRNSASPADNDVIGRIDYRGDDDNGTARDYVTLFSTITDASTATPAGSFAIQTRNGSSQATRLMVDGSGNVLFSTTGTPDSVVGSSGAGMAYEANGFLGIARAGTNLILNRRSTYGNLIILKTDGTDRGAIGVGSGNVVYVGGGDTFLSFFPSSDAIYPANDSGGGRDNDIDLFTSSVRFDDIFATNGTIQTSDQQEKNTIEDSDLGLDFVKRLSPKSYIFNGKTRTHYGLIAQDVETVLSDINKPTSGFAGFIKDDISEEQDGSEYRYGLRYTEFVAPLIKAIKEQQTIIEDLQARITALENA